MAERRDWDRIKAIRPSGQAVVTKNKLGQAIEIEIEHRKSANGGAGRGRAARDKRAKAKRQNMRARSSKRA